MSMEASEEELLQVGEAGCLNLHSACWMTLYLPGSCDLISTMMSAAERHLRADPTLKSSCRNPGNGIFTLSHAHVPHPRHLHYCTHDQSLRSDERNPGVADIRWIHSRDMPSHYCRL